MVGRLRLCFHALHASARVARRLHQHLFKQREGHVMRAGTGDEVSARPHQLHGEEVKVLIAAVGVLYLVCALAKGGRIEVNDEEGGGGFFRRFYVASSVCEMGMLRVELEAIDE